MSQTTAVPVTTDATLPDNPARYLPIPFAVLAVVGLALWFSGGGDKSEPTTGGLVGAGVLCLAMVTLLGFLAWLGRSSRPLVRAGAGVLALGGVTHVVENVLVLGPGRHGKSKASGVWDVINFLSPTAFAILGLGALLAGLGLAAAGWVRIWGVATGVAGLIAGLSSLVAALGFLPPPFNVSLLAWLITLGLRRGK